MYKGELIHEQEGRIDVAIKRIKLLSEETEEGKKTRKYLNSERDVLSTLDKHDHIVRMYDAFEKEEYFYLVFEFCERGEFIADQGCPEGLARQILYQVILALKYCRVKGIAHRDIKPGNILMTAAGCVKLADFGVARPVNFTSEEICTIGIGTHGYTSPESDDGDYSKGDEYAIGCLLFKLLTGRLPFGDPVKNMRAFLKNQDSEKYNFNDVDCSEMCKDFISKLIKRDVGERMAFDEMLSHEFVSGFKVEYLECQCSLTKVEVKV